LAGFEVATYGRFSGGHRGRSALGVLDEYIEVAIAREDVDGGKTAW
jgi:hypothetical protein